MATGVIINWQGESVKTRTLFCSCGRFRPGDFLLFGGQMCRVATVQTQCPYIENPGRNFVMVTLETRTGQIIPARNIGSKEIFRKVAR